MCYILHLFNVSAVTWCVVENYVDPHFSPENFKRIIKEFPKKYLASTMILRKKIVNEKI